jgi:hypothetical protein
MAMISLSTLEDVFNKMRTKTQWNVDGPMLWGYFFFDPSVDKLGEASVYLVNEGYRLVDIHPTDDGDTCLHVERIETHSPQTLFERNEYLCSVAERFELKLYDGMDVGPVSN